jgi:hypothetical protein
MQKEIKVRGESNRRYPLKKCANCLCGNQFIPTDARQLYCCGQCGIDARNDRRKELNSTRFLDEKKLRNYDLILEKLYSKMEKLKLESITIQDLTLAGIDDDTLLVEMAKNEKNAILWIYDYGTTPASQGLPHIKICKRRKHHNGKPKL